jgi:hypothetical protein
MINETPNPNPRGGKKGARIGGLPRAPDRRDKGEGRSTY